MREASARKQAARKGHENRCRYALVGDITDHNAQAIILQGDQIVQVAAHGRAGRIITPRSIPGITGRV